MLASGSADTTVRVWDVGQRLLPHADEWTRVKRRLLCSEQSEAQGGGGNTDDTKFYNIPTLENNLVSHYNGYNNNALTRSKENGEPAMAETVTHKKSGQPEVPEKTDTAAFTENIRSAVRSLRPEILRQAGARAVWRTGRVTAVLEQVGRSANHPTGGAAIALAQTPGNIPLIEVRDRRLNLFVAHAERPKQRPG